MIESILKNCTVEGNIVRLPEGQLDRKIYDQLAKALNGIGGKWKGGKVAGFVFESDPTSRLQQIQGGEKLNLKKEFQFFETPDKIADLIVKEAYIDRDDVVLEPSAGRGAIIRAVRRIQTFCRIDAVELMPENAAYLRRAAFNIRVVHEQDFLEFAGWRIGEYDRIVANPPFSKNQDIDHVQAMYQCLKPGGRLVSVVSTHWQISNNRKEREFREWLSDVRAEIVADLPVGTFSESGTSVPALIIAIDKPGNKKRDDRMHEMMYTMNGPTGHGDICFSDADPGL